MKKIIACIAMWMLCACNPIQSLQSTIDPSPHEKYEKSLEKAGLLESALGKAWLEAGQRALKDSIQIALPFTEAGYFSAHKPAARSYSFEMKAGQVLTVDGLLKTNGTAVVFVDLMSWEKDRWRSIAYSDSGLALSYEFDKDRSCLLRVQPELLANVYFTVEISRSAVLINPVKGATNKSIGSMYGAQRDGGSRTHEGVDIFASKGTHIVAPTHGYITKVGESNLGGKVIWMSDPQRRQTYYFAHLDSQVVKPGTTVRQGQLLGYVGNTGNARTTAPHLHFGIYQSGSKDPLHYIWAMEKVLNASVLDTLLQSVPYKVNTAKAYMYSLPSTKSRRMRELRKHSYVEVIGSQNDWYRVLLPDLSEGYLLKKQLGTIKPWTDLTLTKDTFLKSGYETTAVPIISLAKGTHVDVMAYFAKSSYVRTPEGLDGWLEE